MHLLRGQNKKQNAGSIFQVKTGETVAAGGSPAEVKRSENAFDKKIECADSLTQLSYHKRTTPINRQ